LTGPARLGDPVARICAIGRRQIVTGRDVAQSVECYRAVERVRKVQRRVAELHLLDADDLHRPGPNRQECTAVHPERRIVRPHTRQHQRVGTLSSLDSVVATAGQQPVVASAVVLDIVANPLEIVSAPPVPVSLSLPPPPIVMPTVPLPITMSSSVPP